MTRTSLMRNALIAATALTVGFSVHYLATLLGWLPTTSEPDFFSASVISLLFVQGLLLIGGLFFLLGVLMPILVTFFSSAFPDTLPSDERDPPRNPGLHVLQYFFNITDWKERR